MILIYSILPSSLPMGIPIISCQTDITLASTLATIIQSSDVNNDENINTDENSTNSKLKVTALNETKAYIVFKLDV